MGNRKKASTHPTPAVSGGPTGSKNRKPLAPQLKARKGPTNAATGKKGRPENEILVRPWMIPQYQELTKEDRDIVLDRLRKEIVDACNSQPRLRPYVVRGVNHVARLIAQRELRVVVFATNPDAQGPFGHIPVLCRLHRVPICVLHLSSKAFGELFELSSLSVLGIRRLPTDGNDGTTADGVDKARGVDPPSPELSEAERGQLQSITEFLMAKASKKNHALP